MYIYNVMLFYIVKSQDAITAKWSGWTDDLSGMWEYNIEFFLLTPDPYGRLTEASPQAPVHAVSVSHSTGSHSTTYTPDDAGIYRYKTSVTHLSRVTHLIDNVNLLC